MVYVPKFRGIPEEEVITKSDRAAVDAGCTWDAEAGQRPERFIEQYITPTRGPSANKKVKLMDWQRSAFRKLFSWKKSNGFRRFRSGCLFIPRQNGKSFFASSLALYMLMADKEPGALVVCCACTGKQTKIIFRELVNSRANSEKLTAATHLREYNSEIVYPKGKALLQGLSSEGWGKLGDPPHCAIFDEFSFWGNYKPYEAIKTGLHSRNQPLMFAISTSGTDRSTPAYEMWKYAEAVRDSAIVDQDFFPLVYAANHDAEIHDPTTWVNCNPSIDVTFPKEEYRKWSERAKSSKTEELQFRQYALNQWTTSVNQYLSLDDWYACAGTLPDLSGKIADLAVDLSTTRDLTSVGCMIYDNGRYYFDHHSFCCAAAVEHSEEKNFVRYRQFISEGKLTMHEGNCVDFDDVRAYIRKLTKKYKVRSIAFDPSHNASDTMLMLQGEGLPVEQYRSGPLYFNQPMKRLHELTMDRKIVHPGDSLINWQAQNLEAKKDHRDMIQPHKPAYEAKIDTMVALLMSLSLSLRGQATPQPKRNVTIEVW